jgi:mono/diheme cytochrome c family protein
MRTALRWAGYFAGFLLLLVVLAAASVWFMSSRTLTGRAEAHAETLVAPTPAQLADGPRQLNILGCVSCHGQGLRGKLFFDVPNVAKLYAPNLTLVAAQVDDQRLAQAIRQGVGHDGRNLFVMPSAQYSRLTNAETAALIHAIRLQPRGGTQTPSVSIRPLGRVGIATGKFKMQPDLIAEYAERMPADLGAKFAQGRHLAMTNCAECHGPALGGGEPEPDLKSPDLSIVGAYDLPKFNRLMRTGVPASGRKLKLMDEVARSDFSQYNDAEIAALYAYLHERAQRAP